MSPTSFAIALTAADVLSPGSSAITRRHILGSLVAASSSTALISPARAIVKGETVTDTEAAAAGVVGLYIDLEGCSVCRKGVPATCTGTLIAPDLVLSARHCSDVPRELNGTLTRVVFGSDMLQANAPSRDVDRYVSTADYNIETAGNDLLLIKIRGTAPPTWRPVELPLRLLPSRAEQAEAERAGSPLYPDGIGMPDVISYGYGQQNVNGESDVNSYSAGTLKRIGLRVRTEVRPWAPGFLTTPLERGTGTCAGDSGGGASGAFPPCGHLCRRACGLRLQAWGARRWLLRGRLPRGWGGNLGARAGAISIRASSIGRSRRLAARLVCC